MGNDAPKSPVGALAGMLAIGYASGILPDGGIAYVVDPRIRSAVRAALRHHLGLDIPPLSDGATAR